MPSSEAIVAWRRVCSVAPLRASIEQQHEVGRRTARDHVARVLGVPGGVGDDEPAFRRREVAVGDVDRDALLALGPEPVGEKGEVHVLVAPGQARAFARLRAGPRRSVSSRRGDGR